MKIVHFIPSAEEGVHDVSAECHCGPAIIAQDRLDESSWAGELVYEHLPFGPLEAQNASVDEDGSWVSYLALEEASV